MCQFEERLRRLIDTHLAKMCGNFLCVCVRVCVCMGVRGCLKEKRMLMSIAERLSPFFSQWTGCSQGKRKTHEASCPLPTGNVPACTLARARGHTHTRNSFYSSKFLALPSVLFLSFMFQELLDWIRPVLVSVRYSALSVMPMTSHPLPHGALYTYTGDSETPEVYRTVHQRLRGHLRQSHIQAKKAFYAASPPRGILWENTDYFIRIVVGGDGRIYEGMRVTERAMNASVGSGQYICLRAVITLGFW